MPLVKVEGPRYEMYLPFLTLGVLIGPGMELLGDLAHWRNHLPYPFDIFASAGNLGFGFSVAQTVMYIGLGLRHTRNKRQGITSIWDTRTFSRREARRFKVVGVLIAGVVTALLNCTTETRWGVTHLPIAKMLHGLTPDPLDLIYSVLWSVATILIPWRRVKRDVYRQA